MKKLRFLYSMTIDFSQIASEHNFEVKCLPRTNKRQSIEELELTIEPEAALCSGVDSFGNLVRYGKIEHEHTRFAVSVKGKCTTSGGARPVVENNKGLFRLCTPLTRAGDAIRGFHKGLGIAQGTNLDKARRIMNAVYNYFEYTPKATSVTTAAEEAFALGKGVCQDYAQVMLSLCRLENIPCRYVAGLLIGEGATHAWVEVEQDNMWYALDPTNGTEVEDSHIIVSAGRDSADCVINRGVFRGGGAQTQEIYVLVEEEDM